MPVGRTCNRSEALQRCGLSWGDGWGEVMGNGKAYKTHHFTTPLLLSPPYLKLIPWSFDRNIYPFKMVYPLDYFQHKRDWYIFFSSATPPVISKQLWRNTNMRPANSSKQNEYKESMLSQHTKEYSLPQNVKSSPNPSKSSSTMSMNPSSNPSRSSAHTGKLRSKHMPKPIV